MRRPRPKSDDGLDQILARWQVRLALRDWEIEIFFKRPNEMSNADHQGEVHWVLTKRYARIYVCHPDCYPREGWKEQDVEHTVVHELVHLTLAWQEHIKMSYVEHNLLEQTIEQLTEALVGGYR